MLRFDKHKLHRTHLGLLAGVVLVIPALAQAQEDPASAVAGGESADPVQATAEWGASVGAESPAEEAVSTQPSPAPAATPAATHVPSKEAATNATTDEESTARVPSAFRPFVGNLYFLGGVNFSGVDGMNSRFSSAGFTELEYPSITLGAGGDFSIGRLILGMEWHWLVNVGSDVERNDFRSDMKSRIWLSRIGVDLAKWRGLRIYPLFGIGAGYTTMKISSESGATFDEVLANPAREVRLKQTGLLLDASLGIDYRFLVRENDYKKRFFTLGVRGGYLFNPYSTGWETSSAEISGGPDLPMGGPTVQLLLGFSGEHKKAYWKKGHHHHKK